MKTHRNLTLGLFACLFLLGSCTDSEIVDQKTGGSIATKAVANTDVILHWNTEEQNIDGFGVAQAGWADYLYAHRKRDTVLDLMFGKEGLHLNILRGEIYSHYWKTKEILLSIWMKISICRSTIHSSILTTAPTGMKQQKK